MTLKHNTLKSNDLQDDADAASHAESQSAPSKNSADSAPVQMPDAEIMLEAVRGMSDAERGKLLMALLGLADGRK